MHFLLKFRPASLLFATTLAVSGCGRESPPAAHASALQSLAVPAAAGSLGPNLAPGPDGQVVLSWVEPAGSGHRLLYSVLGDDAWGEPSQVSAGDHWMVNWADFPSVVPLSDTLWAAHWLVQQPAGGYAYDVMLTLSSDGETWSEPIMPHNDGTPTEHGFVSMFPQDEAAGLLWLDGRNTVSESSGVDTVNGTTLRTATIGANLAIGNAAQVDGLICDCCQTDVAMTDAGPVAVYRDRTEDEVRDIYVSRLVEHEWLPGHPVADDGWIIAGCPVNGPAIAAHGSRIAVAWYTAADERPRVRMARSEDGGASFSTAADVVSDAAFGRVGVALLPDNRVAVSWLCKRPEEKAAVCVRSVSSAGEIAPVQVISADQEVSTLSVPQLLRSEDWLVAAWTAEAGGESVISSGRIPIAALD
ncbi:MAG: hypothetical protein ACREQ8_07095 [Woeseiaceae bacterium]